MSIEQTTNPRAEVVGDEVIHHSMLVSDINRDFPQCRPVFEKYGIAGCGGEYGPPEPLFIFAAAHRVALPDFIKELNAAQRGEWKDDRAEKGAPTNEADTENLYKRYVFGALLVALTAGFGLGVVNVSRIAWAQSYYSISGVLKQIHGHAQIFGWVGLFVMGVALHAVPRMKMQALRPAGAAAWCGWLMLAGVGLRVVAQPFPAARIALLASGVLELTAVGLFTWLIVRLVVKSDQPREFHEKFIYAGLAWFLALGVWNFYLVLRMFLKHSVAVPALADALWIQVALFGFAANIIFGFSMRLLPHFLGLRESKVWAANVAFWLWNVAILMRYPVEQLAWAASTLEAVAIGLFVYALGIFARRRTKIEIKDVDRAFAWFIKLGYGWLIVAALTPFHADLFRLSASARHTMAVGFVTPLIFGVAYRVLPIFNGVNLWSNRLLRATFWAQAGGSTIALAMALSVAYPSPGMFAWVAVSGLLVFTALLMFTVNIALTLRTKTEHYFRGAAVKLTTRVTELMEAYPDLRPVLIHNGLPGLATMRHNPPRFVTLEFAARRHGIDPAPLLAVLNAEIKKKTA